MSSGPVAEEFLAESVALLTPTAADATIATQLLSEAHIKSVVCRSFDQLIDAAVGGVGAIVLLYESLGQSEHQRFEDVLAREPPWSTVPIIVLIRRGKKLTNVDMSQRALKSAVLLERPVPIAAFLSAIRAALEARRRQYEIRNLLSEARSAADERARLHAQTVQAYRAAESANRMKDEFLAVVSHELRTPLNAILGWASLLNRGILDKDKAAQATQTIERNARTQAQLIADLLDVSRIISGTLRLDVQPVALVSVIEQALATILPAAEAKGLSIAKIFDPSASPVDGDASRLQQVIWNLLSNAVKFTEPGGRITVVLESVERHVQIRVSDTGRGIAPEFLQLIFERFRQVDSSSTRNYGGLGLGLSIVRQLVELHGGSVIAESPGEGKGASFIVRLPIAGSTHRTVPVQQDGLEPPKPNPSKVSLTGLRILAIDDEVDSLEALYSALSDCGAEVMQATSARSGLELFKGGRINAIICDIGMPQEDGYSFIGKLRALEGPKSSWTPAIALTAYARPEDRMQSLSAGFQMHVAKPADPLDLAKLIANLALKGDH